MFLCGSQCQCLAPALMPRSSAHILIADTLANISLVLGQTVPPTTGCIHWLSSLSGCTQELLQLRKDITVERQKAVSAMRAVKGTAQDSLDVASWTQKVYRNQAVSSPHVIPRLKPVCECLYIILILSKHFCPLGLQQASVCVRFSTRTPCSI